MRDPMRMRWGTSYAHASSHFPTFRVWVGRVTSDRLVRKRQRLPNGGASVGGRAPGIRERGRDPEAEAAPCVSSGEWPLLGRSWEATYEAFSWLGRRMLRPPPDAVLVLEVPALPALEPGLTSVPGLPGYAYHHGPVVWTPEDTRGATETEPAGPKPSHEGTGPGATEARDSGEENHCRHKKDGQAGPDGCCPHHGKRSGTHPTLCTQVCVDAGQHSGCVPQDTDSEIQQLDGTSYEGCHQGHGHHEQTVETAPDPEDHDGV